MHVSIFAERCALTEAQIGELTFGRLSDALWNEKEKIIVRMVEELHRYSTVSGKTWELLRSNWQPSEIVQLILSASFYRMAAMYLNSMAVPLEEGARRFPPGIDPARASEEPGDEIP